ncbi:MAG: hypothetical protein ACYTEY_17010, partial [Planctomycetota bacterium]
MKRAAKIIGWCLVALAAYCVLHVLLVFFPQPLFRHHRTYKNFTVYMRQQVPAEITDVLDCGDTLLAASIGRRRVSRPDRPSSCGAFCRGDAALEQVLQFIRNHQSQDADGHDLCHRRPIAPFVGDR